ncbi:MAG TPA: GNAT family protein [Gemmatimonadales bacterium]|nr:GNAT family protein [Gemmatimonadales bacterium]
MISPEPVVLERAPLRLEPLAHAHHDGLVRAASDGNLWELRYTSVPTPEQVGQYIADALAGQADGTMLPWAVRDLGSDQIVGSTRYHDIVTAAGRVEIGYTWYGASRHRSHVNTGCKVLLLSHAFDTLGCGVVGLRTDILNTRSQRAIERLGARRDGVIRHHQVRRDGSVRDTVMYSLLATEWPAVRARLDSPA